MAGLTKEQRAEREAQKQTELQQQEGVEVAEDVEHSEVADEQPQDDAIAYVTMVRDHEKYDAPHIAQVHPDEVVNYYSGGWVEDK